MKRIETKIRMRPALPVWGRGEKIPPPPGQLGRVFDFIFLPVGGRGLLVSQGVIVVFSSS